MIAQTETTTETTQRAEFSHASWTELLTQFVHVSDDGVNRIDYARFHGDAAARSALNDYITDLAAQPISDFEDAAQFAAWANLYNALTIQVILENYPVDSIRDIRSGLFTSGPWRRDLITVEGETLTLDNIEHDILRVRFDDPRVHYAVNCASIGCPNLQPHAWEAATLDAELEAAAHAYINHPRGVQITENGRLRVSSIYRWFREDFGGNNRGVIAHILTYAEADLAAQITARPEISGHDYDWSLNDIHTGP